MTRPAIPGAQVQTTKVETPPVTVPRHHGSRDKQDPSRNTHAGMLQTIARPMHDATEVPAPSSAGNLLSVLVKGG